MKKDIKILKNTIVCQNKELNTADIDEEKVMMNLEKGRYYGLNSVGTRIWELMEEPIQVDQIIQTLLKEYDVEPAICEENVLSFITKLYQEGICTVSEHL